MAIEHVTAELIHLIIEEALAQQAVINANQALVALTQDLREADQVVADLLGTRPPADRMGALRAEARTADDAHDELHRLIRGLLDSFRHHHDPAVKEAAGLLVAVLYPDGLSIVTAAWETEVAHGTTYKKRLAREDVTGAVATLEPELPRINDYFTRLAEATDALRFALWQIAETEVTRAAQKADPKLFDARVKAITAWTVFVKVAEFVYRGDTPTDRAAREALLGRWYRILALDPSASKASDEAGSA